MNSHCKAGHEYTPENTYIGKEGRRCRECGRLLAIRKRCANPLYDTWYMMIRRCTNPAFKDWHLYGGKIPAITVCERWLMSFDAFVSDMGDRPPGHTLERKDSNGPYCPDNCKWATPLEQSRNTSRTKWIEVDGQIKSPAEWASISGRGYSTIINRIGKGMSGKEAIFGALYDPHAKRPYRKRGPWSDARRNRMQAL